MIKKKFLYIGPSWAAQSFDSPGSSSPSTNLALEWKIPHENLAQNGARILTSVDRIKQDQTNLPIIWIYGEPSFNIKEITGIDDIQFIQRTDWLDLWHQCNQYCLEQISNLGRPVLLVGAPSDITNCDYPNITIAHPSWQRYIASSAGILYNNTIEFEQNLDGMDFGLRHSETNCEKITITEPCWGIDIVHKNIYVCQSIKPNFELVDWTWRMLKFWKYLEDHGRFYDTHPNFVSNKEFAQHLLPIVEKFLEEHK